MIRGLVEAINVVNNKYKSCDIKRELIRKKLATGKLDGIIEFKTRLSTQRDLILCLRVIIDRFVRYEISCPALSFDAGQVIQVDSSIIDSSLTFELGKVGISSDIATSLYDNTSFNTYNNCNPFAVIGSLQIYCYDDNLMGVVNNECVFIFKLFPALSNRLKSLKVDLVTGDILDFNFNTGTLPERYSFFLALEDYRFMGDLTYDV